MRFASVDVDETLYNFADPLFSAFLGRGIDIEPPKEWNCWDYFYPSKMSKETAIECFDLIHSRQREFPHYAYANSFLKWLSREHYIIITSHRKPERKKELIEWLDDSKMFYDEVWVGEDKTKMFDKTFGLVVDDNPHILRAAALKGIIAKGLLKPWNKECLGKDGIKLYKNLKHFMEGRTCGKI